MKLALMALLAFTSTSVFARQYIQCSAMDVETTDVMVINLQTEDTGTLFLSSGMQYPDDERILVNIELGEVMSGKHIYKVQDQTGNGQVTIPSSVIGKNSDSFKVDLTFSSYKFNFSCFARIYND